MSFKFLLVTSFIVIGTECVEYYSDHQFFNSKYFIKSEYELSNNHIHSEQSETSPIQKALMFGTGSVTSSSTMGSRLNGWILY